MENDFYSVRNLLVPAFGSVYCVPRTFPRAAPDTFNINFNTLCIDEIPFTPQSVTIDATDVPASEFVTFVVKQIGFKRLIPGGQNVTFSFPSITNIDISVTPSDAVSPVRAYFYNFPAFSDMAGAFDVNIAGASLDVSIVSPNPLPVDISGSTRQTKTLQLPVAATVGALPLIAAVVGARIKVHSVVCQIPATTALAPTNLVLRGSASLTEILRAGITVAALSEVLEYSPQIPFILTSGDGLDYIYSAATTLASPPVLTIDYEVI